MNARSDDAVPSPRPGGRNLRLGGFLALVGILIAVVGAVVFALFIWRFASDNMIARGIVPGIIDVQIDKPGQYLIYHEMRSTFNGQTFHTSSPPRNLHFEMFDPDGGQVVLDAYGNFNFETPSRAGQSIFRFQAGNPGDYQLRVTDTGGTSQHVISIGEGSLSTFMTTFLTFFCSIFLGGILFLAGVVFLIIGIAQRANARTPVTPQT